MAKYALIVLKMSSISKSFRANFFFFVISYLCYKSLAFVPKNPKGGS